jgi:hypothetical protein
MLKVSAEYAQGRGLSATVDFVADPSQTLLDYADELEHAHDDVITGVIPVWRDALDHPQKRDDELGDSS